MWPSTLTALLSYTLYWALTLWGKKVHVCTGMCGRQRLEIFLNCTQPYIFEARKKNTCSPLILLGWLASEQPGAPSPPPQHWATGVFNCAQLFSWVLEIWELKSSFYR